MTPSAWGALGLAVLLSAPGPAAAQARAARLPGSPRAEPCPATPAPGRGCWNPGPGPAAAIRRRIGVDLEDPTRPPDHWFAPDKLKHFFLSFGTTGFVFAGANAAYRNEAPGWIAPSVAGFAGLGKEMADRRHGWGFSFRDLVWDAAGIAAALAILRD